MTQRLSLSVVLAGLVALAGPASAPASAQGASDMPLAMYDNAADPLCVIKAAADGGDKRGFIDAVLAMTEGALDDGQRDNLRDGLGELTGPFTLQGAQSFPLVTLGDTLADYLTILSLSRGMKAFFIFTFAGDDGRWHFQNVTIETQWQDARPHMTGAAADIAPVACDG